MKKNTLALGILLLATAALAGAAWVSTQSAPVGEGKSVRVMLTPT